MQRESFQNLEIAAILNRAYIPVKIDRELSPVLDQDLIDFAQRTTGRAGWPLQVILTPDGTPLFAFVYLPPQQLKQLLLLLEQRWNSNPGEMARLARSVVEQLNSSQSPTQVDNSADSIEEFLSTADLLSGGFGEQSKFPETPHLQKGLRLLQQPIAATLGDEQRELRDFLLTTLDAMAVGGLHDAIDGGFFRYTIDPDWSTPHFEKMLYDNAQLAELYLRAGKIAQRPDYLSIGQETLDFMISKMRNRQGMFISSLSAVDEAGREGGAYLWSREEIEDALSGEEWALFNELWYPNSTRIEGKIHLFLPNLSRASREQQETILTIRKKLQLLRLQRDLPRDQKVLAGWNGLVLSTFAEAVQDNQDGHYRAVGDQLATTLLSTCWDGQRLLRLCHQRQSTPGTLRDYAYVAQGLAEWGAATQQQEFEDIAQQIVISAEQLFLRNGKWQAGGRHLLRYRSSRWGSGSTATAGEPLPPPVTILQQLLADSAR